jgi:Bacterial CdiA-CT RNAse A domain
LLRPALSYHRGVTRSRVAPYVVLLLFVAVGGCSEPAASRKADTRPPPAAAAARTSEPAADRTPARDLSQDESMGGHTLRRHVGKTDAELRDRLRAEPQISAASTYTDRATAERAVGAAIAEGGRKLANWTSRSGRRPNLVLDYRDRSGQSLGRSYARGQPAAVPCDQAVVVLRWDERRDRYYVLTSYPEASR